MKRVFTVLFVFIISGCASKPPLEISREEMLENLTPSVTSIFKCAQYNLPKMDDRMSDATTIALALSNTCNTEYVDHLKAGYLYRIGERDVTTQEVFRDAYMKKINSDSERIRVFLPYVLNYRTKG